MRPLQLNDVVRTPRRAQPGPERPLHRLRARSTVLNWPLQALWEVTQRCPLRCRHCYLAGEWEEDELDTAEARNLLRQMARMGVMFLTLTGGEPLLRDDLIDLVKETRSLGFVWKLMTTATLLDEDRARRLVEQYPFNVCVSLHGLEETHDTLTSIPGSFRAAVAGIQRLVRFGARVVAKMSLTPRGMMDLPALRELCSRIGVELRIGTMMFPDLDGSPVDRGLCHSDRELAEYLLDCENRRPSSFGRHRVLKQNEPICTASHSGFVVSPRGDVRACIGLGRICGNIRKSSLQKIWQSEAMIEARRLTAGGRIECRGCRDAEFCRFCPALAEAETGSPVGAPPTACREARIRRELAEAESRSPVESG